MVKLVILSLLFMCFLPGICQAEPGHEKAPEEKIYSGTNDNSDFLNSGFLLLLNNRGDLTADISHSTYDKKSYLRLFSYSRYSKVYPPFEGLSSKEFTLPLPDKPGTIDYYIYTLRKIII